MANRKLVTDGELMARLGIVRGREIFGILLSLLVWAAALASVPNMQTAVAQSAPVSVASMPGGMVPTHPKLMIVKGAVPAISSRSRTGIRGLFGRLLTPDRTPASPIPKSGSCATGMYPKPILALVSALKCDPDLLYEYVYNNIEFEPLYGSNKGALGTLLDKRGNDADQAILLVTLWNSAGYFETGYINAYYPDLAGDFVANWLGVRNDATAIEDLLAGGGIPVSGTPVVNPDGTLASIDILHFIPALQIGGTWYFFDPSAKPHTITSGISSISSALGYSKAQFLHDVGGAVDTLSISSVNRGQLRADLTTYATNLVSYINQNNRAWTVGDIIGGKSITPLSGSPIRINYSNPPSSDFPLTCPFQSSECRTSITITMPGASAGQAIKLFTDEVYGHRITVFSVPTTGGNFIPTLKIDGADPSCLPTCTNVGTAMSSGQWSIPVAILQANQPNDSNCPSGVTATRCTTLNVNVGGSFVISTAVGQVGHGMAEYHRQLLAQARAAGGDDSSEPVMGENLAAIGYSWLAEISAEQQITDQIAQATTQYKFATGISGQTLIQTSGHSGPYVDLPVNDLDITPLSSTAPTITVGSYSFAIPFVSVFFTESQVASSLESAVLLQTQAAVSGMTAASTIMLIDANMNPSYTGSLQDTFFADGTTSGGLSAYFSNIRPTLLATYSTGSGSDLDFIDHAISTNGTAGGSPTGKQLLLPSNGHLSVGLWTGAGYTQIYALSGGIGILQKISGGLSGGYTGTNDPQSPTQTTTAIVPPPNSGSVSTLINPQSSPSNTFTLEPVDTIAGAYIYNHNDIVTGGGAFPYSLSFSRTYSSASGTYLTSPNADQGMGNGWTNTYSISAQIQSDPYIGTGYTPSPAISAASSIAALYVMQDLLSTTPTAQTATISSMVAQWFTDQITGNIVMVSQPGTSEAFVALPHDDGATTITYNAPPGSSTRVTQTGSGQFTYTLKDGTTLSFGGTAPAGALENWVFSNGMSVNLSYTGSLLSQVSNNLGRSLTLGYIGNDVSQVTDDTGRSVSYTYDSNHNLEQFTDALGFNTTYSYDASGAYDVSAHLTQVFYPSHPTNPFVTNWYDPMGRVGQQANANGNVTDFYFAGPRSEIVDAAGDRHVTYQTDRGRVLKDDWVLDNGSIGDVFYDTAQSDGVINVTANQYDGLDRLNQTILPGTGGTTYFYDSALNPWANNIALITQLSKSGSGLTPLVTRYKYDPTFNKPTQIVDPLGLITTMSYEPVTGNMRSVMADFGTGSHFNARSSFTYNRVGQALTTTDPIGTVTKYAYDSSGNPTSITRDYGGLNQVTSLTYSPLGDVLTTTDPNGNVSTATYDTGRRLSTSTTPALSPEAPTGRTTSLAYDRDGRTIQSQISASGSVLSSSKVTYTLTGELATATDPNGNVTHYAYDSVDRLLSVTDPIHRITTYGYDAMSRQVSISNPAIQANPLLQKTYTPDGPLSSLIIARDNSTTDTTSYAYDGFDRLVTATYPDSSTETYTFDADSNVLTRKTRRGDTITLTYDTLNRVSTKAAPSEATVNYAYDLAGRLASASDASASIAAPSGSSASYAATYTYDAVNRPLNVSWNPAPTQTPTTPNTTTLTHAYDATNRRVGQTATDNSWWSYPTSASSVSYTANNLNQYSAVGAVTPAYDGNGNLTYDGTYKYCYDAESRLTSIVSAGTCASPTTTLASYAYDAQGRRKSKTVSGTTTVYITDADNREALEYDGTGVTHNWYAYGLGPNDALNRMDVSGGARETFIPDIQGSFIGGLASGGTLSKFGYQSFGENPSSNSGTFRYTGQRIDPETGGSASQPSALYYYRARMYSPTWGRFMQSDPMGYPGGPNLYAYVGNDPLNGTDPYGLWTLQATVGINVQAGPVTLQGSAGLAIDNHENIAS